MKKAQNSHNKYCHYNQQVFQRKLNNVKSTWILSVNKVEVREDQLFPPKQGECCSKNMKLKR